MRKLKFRAKRIDNREWVYGSVVIDTEWNKAYIYQNELVGAFWQLVKYEVDPETIGQFTGTINTENKDLYEDDIVSVTDGDGWEIGHGKIIFKDAKFQIEYFDGSEISDIDGRIEIVTGNIHDNPNLIEDQNE